MSLPRLTLVLGGANSGKSLFAERLIEASGLSPLYIATAQAFDEEMTAKIKAHKNRRGLKWGVVEEPYDLANALMEVPAGHAVLVDCLTFWLSNHLLQESDLDVECDGLLATLRGLKREVVLVSNEVGMGVVPDHPLGRRFRSAQGAMNQRVAEQADLVVVVMAGLPLVLKGQLPS
jgi:adenosylcobinamide kinase / adenosylcobinamide-phosphate guanylyltransferase